MKNPLPYPLFLAIILFYSCSKSSSEQSVQPIKPPVTPAADQTPDVYATGAVYRGYSIAAYWKNDSLVEMTQSPMIGEGLGIAVSAKTYMYAVIIVVQETCRPVIGKTDRWLICRTDIVMSWQKRSRSMDRTYILPVTE